MTACAKNAMMTVGADYILILSDKDVIFVSLTKLQVEVARSLTLLGYGARSSVIVAHVLGLTIEHCSKWLKFLIIFSHTQKTLPV